MVVYKSKYWAQILRQWWQFEDGLAASWGWWRILVCLWNSPGPLFSAINTLWKLFHVMKCGKGHKGTWILCSWLMAVLIACSHKIMLSATIGLEIGDWALWCLGIVPESRAVRGFTGPQLTKLMKFNFWLMQKWQLTSYCENWLHSSEANPFLLICGIIFHLTISRGIFLCCPWPCSAS